MLSSNNVAFFYFLEAIYVFFAVSTHRHEICIDAMKTVGCSHISVPKRVYTTRWSYRSDAVKALIQGFHAIRKAHAKTARHEDETSKVRSGAIGLHDKMCKLDNGVYAGFCFGMTFLTELMLQVTHCKIPNMI